MPFEPSPPPTHREDTADTLHGRQVRDPYRWLEDADSQEVAEWTEAQTAYTRSLLDALPYRAEVRDRLAGLLSIGQVTTPVVRGSRHFYTRRDAGQDQPVLVMREGLEGEDRVILDPNGAEAENTVALDWWYPSDDGRLVAYGYSKHGDEKSTLYILGVDSGDLLSETIPYTRYSSVAWEVDGKGFYYTRHPAPGTVPDGEENYHKQVYHHRLGSDPSVDARIYGEGRNMTDVPSVRMSPDGRYLLLTVSQGWTRTEVFVRDLTVPGSAFTPIITGVDAIFEGEISGDTLFLRTNDAAPRYKVIAVDLHEPNPAHHLVLVPERPDTTIVAMHMAAGVIALDCLRDVAAHAELYSLDGEWRGEVPLPPLCSVTGLGGEQDGEHVLVGYESYTVPPAVVAYSPETGETVPFAATRVDVELPRMSVRQVWYTSKDGTQVPLAIIGPEDLVLDGNNPALLYGYGGFNLSLAPTFYRWVPMWVEMGGVYAVATLRGGSEFGEEWHRAGMLGKKQNVFDDFASAAEYLIKEKYTRSERLAIYGRSNGGLLVGAAFTQRPDLYRAVVCQVPLLDMLRYQNYRIARLWIAEYGSAEDPEQFEWLYAYSPYHSVRPGKKYPAVLFTTAWSDSRVDPMHARKMTALMQAETGSDYPVAIRVEEKAGHGQGKPVTKLVEEQTDIWCFLIWQLGARD